MFNAFNRPPQRRPFVAFHVGPPPTGTNSFRSLKLSVPQLPVHFKGKSFPCFGTGCPLCPTSPRPMAYLPCVATCSNRPLLLAFTNTDDVKLLAADWGLGWTFDVIRGERKSRIENARQSLHAPSLSIEDRDIQCSLAKLWHLPSPDDFVEESAWITASIAAIINAL